MKIGELSFRELGRNFIAIKGYELRENIKNIDFPKESDSILTWCYFDHECGITFEFLCPFNLKENKYYEIKNKDFSMKWRKGAVNEYEMEIILRDVLKSKKLWDYIFFIVENYENNDDLNETRQVKDIDHLREKDYPDDIMITLYKENLNPETLWVRLLTFNNGNFNGKLQNEPFQNFGIHLGDIIEIKF